MADIWGLLGDLEFTLADAPGRFSHTRDVVLPEHATIENRPSLQFTGWELETLSLGFRWSVGWCDPDEQLQRLWDAQDKHQPMRLVLGSGTWKRKWVIEEVSDSLVQTDPAGNTLSIEATVKLKDAGKSIATTETTIGLAVRNKLGIVALGKR